MLKDLFKKKNKDLKETIAKSLMDGYVDIKAYKHDENGNKIMVYHDTGDNTITDWMRHAIMLMLSGYSLSFNGNKVIDGTESAKDKDQISKPNSSYHSSSDNNGYNKDGYCLNGEQYLWEGSDSNIEYPTVGNSTFYGTEEQYSLFPTKVLLGTGCEYTDWQSLKDANEEENATWYTNMINTYGDGDVAVAESAFDSMVGLTDEDTCQSNQYSGTIGLQGLYSGSGSLVRAITVNDPDNTTNVSSSAEMSKRYGVVGAIKTIYCPDSNNDCSEYLEETVSDSGRLIKGKYRGAGRPCFIYFNRTSQTQSNKLDWDEVTSDISVQRDSSSNYLNRITFRIVIPAQSSGTGAIGEYNPFNGYTFKQIGLFNDALINTVSNTTNPTTKQASNMPCGMMLAVKNIQNFTKTADESIEFTWTLTI
jgi:hypothetical protein